MQDQNKHPEFDELQALPADLQEACSSMMMNLR
jgi:hypothetical protein